MLVGWTGLLAIPCMSCHTLHVISSSVRNEHRADSQSVHAGGRVERVYVYTNYWKDAEADPTVDA